MIGQKIEYCEYIDSVEFKFQNGKKTTEKTGEYKFSSGEDYLKKLEKTRLGCEIVRGIYWGRPYFDYDGGLLDDIGKFMEEEEKFNNELMPKFKKWTKIIFGTEKIALSESHLKDFEKNQFKISFHIILPEVFLNMGKFWTYMKQIETEFKKKFNYYYLNDKKQKKYNFDFTIYKSDFKKEAKFRSIYSDKKYKNKTLNKSLPRLMNVVEGEPHEHLILYVDKSKEITLNNLIKEKEIYEESKEEEKPKEKKENNLNQQCIKKYLDDFIDDVFYDFDGYDSWFKFGSMIYGIFNGNDEGYKLFQKVSKLSTFYKKNKMEAEKEIYFKWNNQFSKEDFYNVDINYFRKQILLNGPIKLYNEVNEFLKCNLDIFEDVKFITDKFISDEFIKEYGTEAIYCIKSKKWYTRNRYGIYKDEPTYLNKKLTELGKKLIRGIQILKTEHFRNKEKYEHFNRLETQLMRKIFNSTGLKDVKNMMAESDLGKKNIPWDEDRNYWAFNNGVYDLKQNKLLSKPPRNVFISKTCGYDYSPKVNEKIKNKLMETLKDIHDNPQILEHLFKTLSRSIEGNPDEKISFWLGIGGNGKGVLKDILINTFGEYCTCLPGEYFQKSKQGRRAGSADSELDNCRGARLVVADEFHDDEKLNVTKLKELSGRTKTQTRKLNENSSEWTPDFSMIFVMNLVDMPRFNFGTKGTKNDNNALKRRLITFDFQSVFTEDPDPSNPKEKKSNSNIKKELKEFKLEMWRILKDYYISETVPDYTELKKIRDKFLSESSKLNTFIKTNFYSEDKTEDFLFKFPTKEQFKKINKNKDSRKKHLMSIKDLSELVYEEIKEKYNINELSNELKNLGYYELNNGEIIETSHKGTKLTPFISEESEFF